jgi:hypothetical protein
MGWSQVDNIINEQSAAVPTSTMNDGRKGDILRRRTGVGSRHGEYWLVKANDRNLICVMFWKEASLILFVVTRRSPRTDLEAFLPCPFALSSLLLLSCSSICFPVFSLLSLFTPFWKHSGPGSGISSLKAVLALEKQRQPNLAFPKNTSQFLSFYSRPSRVCNLAFLPLVTKRVLHLSGSTCFLYRSLPIFHFASSDSLRSARETQE